MNSLYAVLDGSVAVMIWQLCCTMRMEFERLLEIVGDEPVFETGLPLAGDYENLC
jgi:hypothetical protein